MLQLRLIGASDYVANITEVCVIFLVIYIFSFWYFSVSVFVSGFVLITAQAAMLAVY